MIIISLKYPVFVPAHQAIKSAGQLAERLRDHLPNNQKIVILSLILKTLTELLYR